ncbi:MAG: beta-hydroxyacyl-ACP dehydratase [Paludibacteraceae bacterium]|nr:beta-hydroxyacyl-ACP dehydratase [Paludibacteraceae bacterium]
MENYYSLIASTIDGLSGLFRVQLNPDCRVYEGHFPGSPVSPGVCNIRMMLECAEQVAHHPLNVRKISRCRFTTLLSPQTHPELEIQIDLQPKEDGLFILNASIGKEEEVYQTLKAEVLNTEC